MLKLLNKIFKTLLLIDITQFTLNFLGEAIIYF